MTATTKQLVVMLLMTVMAGRSTALVPESERNGEPSEIGIVHVQMI